MKRFYSNIYTLVIVLLFSLGLNSCIDNSNGPGDSSYADIVSFTYTISPTDWRTTHDYGHWYARITVPEITNDVIDYGAVLFYMVNSDGAFVPLPFTSVNQLDSVTYYSEEVWASFFTNGADIDYKYTAPNSTPPEGNTIVKVVVINSYYVDTYKNKIAEYKSRINRGDYPSYESVRKDFNLKEVDTFKK